MKFSNFTLVIILSLFLLKCFTSCKQTDSPTAPLNHLPKIESLTANPAAVLINSETILTCIATDQDGDNLTITWSSKVGTFSSGVVGVAVKWVSPSTSGIDTITVIVNDGKQTIQGKLGVSVGTSPAPPILSIPTNNSIDIIPTPTLTWNSIGDGVTYNLQVSSTSTFDNYIFNQSGIIVTSQMITGLSLSASYYWRVNVSNLYGTSAWSNTFTFKTVLPPTPPTLTYPVNDANQVELAPIFTWSSLNTNTSYSLQVSTTNSFNNLVYNQGGLTLKTQQVSGLALGSTYYWRVNAANLYAVSNWSNIFSFTTGTLPNSPLLSLPISGLQNIALPPILSWTSVANAKNYNLQVSTANTFTDLVFNQNVGSNLNCIIHGLSPFVQYFWRVNAANNIGISSWSTVWTFTTTDVKQSPPIISNLVMPASIKRNSTIINNFIISITASDPNGLSDIYQVHFRLYRPDGTLIDPGDGSGYFIMVDNGDVNMGDANAHDGIYSFNNSFSNTAQTGVWKFEFQAVDGASNLSNIIVQTIIVN